MDVREGLAARFEQQRPRLRALAYRMLGSAGEAEDAVQEAWLRLDRADTSEVENLDAWLTTVVARLCLSMLRSRERHRAEPLDEQDPGEPRPDPEQEAVLADSVGLAMLVVLDALAPAERVAFVLHDMFAVPFDEIAVVLGKTPAATRQLASRARRRVKGPAPDPDLPRQRKVVEAFLAASRGGDFGALLELLDPDVVLHADRFVGPSPAPIVLKGLERVRQGAVLASARARVSEVALVDGKPGLLMAPAGKLSVVLTFTVGEDRITGIEVIADPARIEALEFAVLD